MTFKIQVDRLPFISSFVSAFISSLLHFPWFSLQFPLSFPLHFPCIFPVHYPLHFPIAQSLPSRSFYPAKIAFCGRFRSFTSHRGRAIRAHFCLPPKMLRRRIPSSNQDSMSRLGCPKMMHFPVTPIPFYIKWKGKNTTRNATINPKCRNVQIAVASQRNGYKCADRCGFAK